MGAVAIFDPAAFQAAYPQFATLTPAQLGQCFAQACLYLANNGTGPVPDVPTQTMLLWLLTAHVAQLTCGVNGQAPSGLVGRISSASEGSVSVSTDMGSGNVPAFYAQTQFGLLFWQSVLKYRSARYVAGPRANTAAYGAFWPYGVGR